MSGTKQFKRYYELLIDDLLIKTLDVSFTIVRSLDSTPNTMELDIYNLNPDHRKQLQQKAKPVAQLTAGYEGKYGVLFLGECPTIRSVYETSGDWVTSVSSADGEDAMAESRVNLSFGPGASIETVVLKVAESMGDIGLEELRNIMRKAKLPKGLKSFKKGVTVSGPAKKELNRLLLACGLQWSIQNRKFQVLEANKTLGTEAVVLSPTTGLIGSPVIDSDGTMEFKCLLNSDIVPGKQIVIDSKAGSGRWRCDRVEYSGATDGDDWYCNGHARYMIDE